MKFSGIVAFLTVAALGAAASFPSVANAGNSGVNFDQGISVSDILKQAKAGAAAEKTVIQPAYIGQTRYDRDCVTVTFSATDKPVSDRFSLRSTEWVTECHNTGGGGTYPGPGGHPVPVPPTQNCWERPGFHYNEVAQVTLQDRQPLLPWEYDKFQVCLEGPWLSLYSLAAAYDYKMVQGGNRDGNFILAPIKKLAMKPDPVGITAQAFTADMVLTLKDKWASYYQGEQTVLKVALRKEVSFWPDQTVIEKDITLAPADLYTVNFMDYAKEFTQKLEAGRKYYVQYSFQRIGRISKPDLMKVGDTEKVPYQAATLALAD